jgi:hypothetical protein
MRLMFRWRSRTRRCGRPNIRRALPVQVRAAPPTPRAEPPSGQFVECDGQGPSTVMIRSRPASGFIAGPLEGASPPLRDSRPSCDATLKPKSAFSRFHPVRWADLRGRQRLDLTRSPSLRRTTGICALPSFKRSRGKAEILEARQSGSIGS